MKERPILFKPEMVKAILEGRKTQTRRIIEPQPDGFWGNAPTKPPFVGITKPDHGVKDHCWNSPYGMPGDRLWVKEKHCFLDVIKSARKEMGHTIYNLQVEYSDGTERHHARYDEEPKQTRERGENKWRSSMFMPRWASRITLEIRGVRIERLKDIAIGDCFREGIDDRGIMAGDPNSGYMDFARDDYRMLWEKIHGPGSWDLNPWVWVIEFKRVESKRL